MVQPVVNNYSILGVFLLYKIYKDIDTQKYPKVVIDIHPRYARWNSPTARDLVFNIITSSHFTKRSYKSRSDEVSRGVADVMIHYPLSNNYVLVIICITGAGC